MKELIPIQKDNKTFEPVYTVNDWGYVGYFIGHNYQSSYGTHSIKEQTDFQIARDFICEALFPDGTINTVEIVAERPVTVNVSDMGNTYQTMYNKYSMKTTINSLDTFGDIDNLFINLESIK